MRSVHMWMSLEWQNCSAAAGSSCLLMRSILRHIAVSMCKHWDAIFLFARPINSLGRISVCSGENTNGWTNWRHTKCDLPQRSLRKSGKREPKASRASQELRVLSIISRKPDTKRTEAAELAERGIFVWSGNFYAADLIERLGLSDSGGVLRLGFTHYHTIDEVDRTIG